MESKYRSAAEAQAAEPAPPGYKWDRVSSEDACDFCKNCICVGSDHPECETVALVRDRRY